MAPPTVGTKTGQLSYLDDSLKVVKSKSEHAYMNYRRRS